MGEPGDSARELEDLIRRARQQSSGHGIGIRAEAWAVGAKRIAESPDGLTGSWSRPEAGFGWPTGSWLRQRPFSPPRPSP